MPFIGLFWPRRSIGTFRYHRAQSPAQRRWSRLCLGFGWSNPGSLLSCVLSCQSSDFLVYHIARRVVSLRIQNRPVEVDLPRSLEMLAKMNQIDALIHLTCCRVLQNRNSIYRCAIVVRLEKVASLICPVKHGILKLYLVDVRPISPAPLRASGYAFAAPIAPHPYPNQKGQTQKLTREIGHSLWP